MLCVQTCQFALSQGQVSGLMLCVQTCQFALSQGQVSGLILCVTLYNNINLQLCKV